MNIDATNKYMLLWTKGLIFNFQTSVQCFVWYQRKAAAKMTKFYPDFLWRRQKVLHFSPSIISSAVCRSRFGTRKKE